MDTTDDKPKFLGKTAIPTSYQQRDNRAQFCRKMLEKLTADQADLYEFATKKEAEDYRSMLYSMAILKYSVAGKIATRIMDNMLYVWLAEEQ